MKLNKILELVKYLFNYIARRRWSGSRKKPRVINYAITDVCNSRCVMCNIWQNKPSVELSCQEIGSILSDSLYSEVEHLGVSGGEPSLRNDLDLVIATIVDSLPKLKSISITTHGFNAEDWSVLAPKIKKGLKHKGVDFKINVSVDGIGEMHNLVRRVDDGFSKVCESLKIFNDMKFTIQLQCTVTSINAYGVGGVLDFGIKNNIEVVFRVATIINRLNNLDLFPSAGPSQDQVSFIADFFASELLLKQTRSLSRRFYYKRVAMWLTGKTDERNFPCYFQNEGVYLSAFGDIYNCSVSDVALGSASDGKASSKIYWSEESNHITDELIESNCDTCIHDQTGAWNPAELFLFVLSESFLSKWLGVFRKATSIIKNICVYQIYSIKSKKLIRHQHQGKIPLKSALLIGAYGGEHVGDAAILGGVASRLTDKYGINDFYIASFRVDRTERWVRTIQVNSNTKIKVIPENEIYATLDKCDSVFYAGGPLMNIPTMLSKHLSTLSVASNRGKFVGAEGIGVGPLGTLFSNCLVKRILRCCDSITARTSQTLKIAEAFTSSQHACERDPAFDYLENLKVTGVNGLPKLLTRQLNSIDGCTVIGINLRPLWAKYNLSSKNLSEIESRVLVNISAFINTMSSESSKPIKFIYFAMNADQFGFSDLSVGYNIKGLLDHEIDFEVIEHELDIEQLTFLINKMDVVISMRFHGCIFALVANSSNVIGIDYQVGETGKISDLFHDERILDRVLSVETFCYIDLVKLTRHILARSKKCDAQDRTAELLD